MIISEKDSDKLDDFIRNALNFLRDKIHFSSFSSGSDMDSARLLGDIVVPSDEEAIFMLDKEFEMYIVYNLVRYVDLLSENINNPMFGLGERTLYEYITNWHFLVSSGLVPEASVERVKTLLFAAYYKDVDSDSTNYGKYMERKANHLKNKDRARLDSEDFSQLNNYVWEVIKGIVQPYPKARKGTIDSLGGAILFKHQSMRLHANPNALSELMGEGDKTVRSRLVIAFNLRQAVEYYRNELAAKKLIYSFDKFWQQNTLKEGER